MKKLFYLFIITLTISCKKEESRNLDYLSEKVKTNTSYPINYYALHGGRTSLDPKKSEYRKLIAEKYLLTLEDMNRGMHLHEIISVIGENKDEGFYGFVMLNETETEIESTNGAFKSAPYPIGNYTGYLLFNDGCFHHGTFYYSPSAGGYFFMEDPIFDSSQGHSPGFPHLICLSDEEFEGMC